ncbi:hypothetical protein HPB48_025113 [Haemaphysalis longicornis]|uniref:C2 domain-containing protein n=1 Tax=Haemaphysalis longicornis TaxID=44386 RepID=A0A9J6H9W8_HAELO|nr:hypothetical protein HPB48_025113 [Haemaphysalis longicornis]
MPSFTGTVKLKICEAVELKPTDLTTRHANVVGSKPQLMLIDPYVSINVDDILISRSSTKQRTFKPVWNEYFTAEVHGAQNLGFTVFHAALPSDDFVANCSVSFDELANSAKEQGSNENDIWVSAIPSSPPPDPRPPDKSGNIRSPPERPFAAAATVHLGSSSGRRCPPTSPLQPPPGTRWCAIWHRAHPPCTRRARQRPQNREIIVYLATTSQGLPRACETAAAAA